MNETTAEREKEIAEITARMDHAYREARKGEARLKLTLELRRLRRLVEAKRLKSPT